MTMWYWSDGNGCSKGKTFLTVHMVSTSETVVQIHGEEVGTEPVIGAAYVGAKLVVARQSGPKTVVPTGLSVVEAPTTGTGRRYRRTTWVEQPRGAHVAPTAARGAPWPPPRPRRPPRARHARR